MAYGSNPYYVAPINVPGAMQQGMEMRELRDQYGAKQKMRELSQNTDWSQPDAIRKASQEAMKLGPEAAAPYMDMLDRMDDQQRKQAQQLREATGRIALQIKNAMPEQKAALWQQAAGVYPEAFGQQYQLGAEDQILNEAQTFDQLMAQRQKQETAALEAPKTVGGMQWNPNTRTFDVIPGYTQQAAAIAAAGRAPPQPRSPTELETLRGWLNSPDPQLRAIAQQKLNVNQQGVSTDTFNQEEKIRDDFNQLPEVKTYKAVIPIIKSAAKAGDTRAGDLNLIYAMGKIFDPTSVVREGELQMADSTGAPLSQVQGYFNYLQGGGRLPPDVRANLVAELNSRVGELEQQYQQSFDTYGETAKSYGLDPNRTLGTARTHKTEAPPPPPGFVPMSPYKGPK